MSQKSRTSNFTSEQLTAIRAEHHLLIEAGAGSGKTTTLVEKILYELGAEVDGQHVATPCRLDEIVAITFTNAAAADLKRKLRNRLRREAAHTGDARWAQMVYDVDRAPIGTIHGFCASILREYALRLDIDPYFAVLEEHESAALREECAHAAVTHALSTMDELAIELVAAAGLDKTVTMVSRAAADAARAVATLERWDGEDMDGSALAARVAEMATKWGIAGELQPDAAAEARSVAAGIWLLRIARDARDRMRERCDASSSMDFDMLITRSREALAEPEIVAALRRRIRWVCIDEFQDTDPVQLEIGYRLCGLWAGDETSAAPRLCIIGDPKQSIYRFRHADVSVWRAVVQRFKSIGIEPVRLTKNFRSRAPIMGLVNATFDGLIGHGPQGVMDAGHETDFVALEAHRHAPEDDEIVEIVRVPVDGKVEAQRRVEAEWIVARIQAMVDGEEIVWDDSGPTPVWRRPRWSDFALLSRARTDIAIYEAAFLCAGIPFVVNGGRGFFQSRSILDVSLLFAALVDPSDNLSWLGLLRSPFIGLRDETVLRFALEHRGTPLSAILEQATPPLESECVARARAWIATLRAMRDRVDVATLLRYAIESSGYAAQAMFRDDGDATLANLQKLMRIADAEPKWSVAEFLAQLRQRTEQESKEAEAPLYTAGEDVVTITTVHGAKGLEWPIVFLYDLRRDIHGKDTAEALYFDPHTGVSTNVLCDSTQHALLRHRERALARAEEKRLWYVAATRARDYLVLCVPDVEATGAPDGECIADSAEVKKVHEWMRRAIAPATQAYRYGGVEWHVRDAGVASADAPIAAAPARDLPSADALDDAAPLGEELARMVRAIPCPLRIPRRSATELMQLDDDPEAHRDRYMFGLPDRRLFRRDGSEATPPGVPARIMGDILHASLEEQIAEADLDRFHERELSERLGEAVTSPRVLEAKRKLRELALAARANPAVAALYDAPGSERELPFTWFRRPEGGEVAVIQGAMDLVGRVGDDIEILDYKSHRLTPGQEAETAAKYGLQRDLYAEALRAILGTAPTRFTFYFPETDTPVVAPLDARDGSERLARIDRLLMLDHAAAPNATRE